MYCEKCGTQNPDNMKFCENCGNQLAGTYTPAETQIYAAPVKKSGKKIWIPIVAVVVAAAIAAGAWFLLKSKDDGDKKNSGNQTSSVDALKKYNNGMLDADAEAVWAVSVSPYSEDWNLDEDEKKEALQEAEEALKESKEERKDEGIEISFKDYKVSKKYEDNEVKKIEDFLNENYGCDTDQYALQDVHVVKVTSVTKKDGDKDTDSEETVMIKVDGKWYVDWRLTMMGKDGIKEILKGE